MPKARLPFSPIVAPIALAMLLAGCGKPDDSRYQGYVEGEYLYLAAPQQGYLKSLDSPRGSRVTAGQLVFAIETAPDDRALAESEARAESALQKLQNLKEPRRRSEIAALEADLRSAQANQRLTLTELQRKEALVRKNFVSKAELDEARSAHDQAVAHVQSVQQQIATYRSTLGRHDEVRSAEADYEAALAEAAQKRWVVDRKTVIAPDTGEISDTYYRPGEWISAGDPVASLLPDTRRRLRFYVPENVVAKLKPGQAIEATCDGCSNPIRGKIDFIAAQAEYTPPVIYSRDSREKLVFRVEAAAPLEQSASLRPGLPIDVHLIGQ